MTRTGTTPYRSLFDPSQPHGIAWYPTYRVSEVALLTGISPDKVRSLFRDKHYGKVTPVPSQRLRPHKTRNYVMLLIHYDTLMNFLGGKSAVA